MLSDPQSSPSLNPSPANSPTEPLLSSPPTHPSRHFTDLHLYFHVLLLGLLTFGLSYGYLTYLQIPGTLNKAVADTSVALIGSSMILSGICYFWNFLDHYIIYRKHLGLIGFAFGVVHFILSFSAFQRLFQSVTWTSIAFLPPLAGLLATLIFAVMALISNQIAVRQIGGQRWRLLLRYGGYLALLFVLVHVTFLKYSRWLTWLQEDFPSLPSLSLLSAVFIITVVLMRLALWWSSKRHATHSSISNTSHPSST